MLSRTLEKSIFEALKSFPAVGILGSRQVGKTTLAKTLSESIKPSPVYLDLELPSDNNRLEDAELYLKSLEDKLVVIDEVQRRPDLFPLLRALIDRNRKPARFLLLGSASPELMKHSSESLAGRICYFELPPLTLAETGSVSKNIVPLWLRGGYPESFLAADESLSSLWRESFIRTFLERDIPHFGLRVTSTALRRFWTMSAHLSGQLWNASSVSRNLGLTAPTVNHYLDIFEETFLIRRLQPYFVNIGKRLVKSPKCYLRDSGLLHSLLAIKSYDDLLARPVAGHSFEGFVIEQIISILPQNVEKFFYRSAAGAEIDLLLTGLEPAPVAVEIKYSSTPRLSRGFRTGFSDLGCGKGFVIHPGEETYPLDKNILALSIFDLDMISK